MLFLTLFVLPTRLKKAVFGPKICLSVLLKTFCQVCLSNCAFRCSFMQSVVHALSLSVPRHVCPVRALRPCIRAGSPCRCRARMYGLPARMKKMQQTVCFYNGFTCNICTVWNKKCNFAFKQLVGLSLELLFQRKVRAT